MTTRGLRHNQEKINVRGQVMDGDNKITTSSLKLRFGDRKNYITALIYRSEVDL